MDNQRDFYIKEKFEKDDLISKKADDVFNNFFASIKNENQEIKQSSKINQEYNREIKEEKSNKENVINFEKAKEKKFARKKLLSAVASLMIIFIGANVYAATMGYNNIFFIIRDFVKEQIITDRDEILSDRDITISYKSIEIAKGIKMQINRLVVEENTAKLYIKVDKSNTNLNITPFTYLITDEKGKELANYASTKDYYVHTEEIELNNFSENTEIINLNIKGNNGADLVDFKIDLVNQEIEVIGSEKELEKISEVELKKYLGAFAFLNFEDECLNENTTTDIELENERNILVARELAALNRVNIWTNDNYSESGLEDVLDPDKINKIVSSFTNLQTEDDGLMEVGGIYTNKDKINGIMKYVYIPNYDGKLTGLCLDVKNIIYSQGIYTVTYTYCYPSYDPSGESYEEGVENLPVYEMTIGLTINEDDEYSKYFVSSKMESSLVEEGKVETEIAEPVSHEEKLEFYLNLVAIKDVSPINVLNRLDLISFAEYDELSKNSDNIITNLVKGVRYIKTNTKYSVFEEKMLNYCTQEMLEKDFTSFKNYNGYLAIIDIGEVGAEVKIEDMNLAAEERNIEVYIVSVRETKELYSENITYYVTFEEIDGVYVISEISTQNTVHDTEAIINQDNLTSENVNNDNNYSESKINMPEENTSNISENVNSEITSKIDNYASSMEWLDLYTPGLKSRVPKDWAVTTYKNVYTGEEDDLEIATVVNGVAQGINKETNEIVTSNMTITYYMPDMMDTPITVEEYGKIIAQKYNANYTDAGYSSLEDNELEWLHLWKTENNQNTSLDTDYYCHIELTDNGTRSIGYVIKFQTDNTNNYKVINIMNWIFGDIRTTSF